MKTAACLAALALAPSAAAQTINTDVDEIPQSIGGTQKLFLTAGLPFAGDTYFVAGTLAGTSPGFVLQGFHVPLNLDFYFTYTTTHPNGPILSNSFGTFDINGFAQASFTLPAGYFPSLVGMTASHAYLALDPATFAITGASNAADCDLVPGPLPPSLVINEVDYDQSSGNEDTLEYVEILNVSAGVVDLTNYVVQFVDGSTGSGIVYGSQALGFAGTLDPGGYLVLKNTAVTIAPGAKQIVIGTSDTIQDGPADAIRIVDSSSGAVIDAVGYGGTLTGFTEGSSDLIFDIPDIGPAALNRCPNGGDTDDNDTDFGLIKSTTPGAHNGC